jgi:hypothetical protein
MAGHPCTGDAGGQASTAAVIVQMTDYTGVFTPLAMDRSLPSKASIQPIILLLAAKAINAALHGAPPARWIVVPSSSGPNGMFFVIFSSLFAEERGWRGFAHPHTCRPATSNCRLALSCSCYCSGPDEGPGNPSPNRPEAQQTALISRLGRVLAFFALRFRREVDHHDDVPLDDADQRGQADERIDVQIGFEERQRRQRPFTSLLIFCNTTAIYA